MIRPVLFFAAALALILALSGAASQARTLDLAFLPPVVEPQGLCSPDEAEDPEADLSIGTEDEALTDPVRLRFIRRDIRRLQAQDADRWFDFISTLIDWQARIDPAFTATDVALAKIALHVDAGRMEALKTADLIDRLRQSGVRLDNAQSMALAQYYLNGIGVTRDEPYAYTLMREAAYGGNVDALLAMARLELDGKPVEGWDAPLDLTVTLAFGGMLGQMNAQVCAHAARIARAYVTGDVVTPNPDIAFAWNKFAADLGGGEAAWRVVEYHLNADAAHKDNTELVKYLGLATSRGFTLDQGQAARVKSSGALDEATLTRILGYNFSEDTGRTRPSLSPYLHLTVNLDGQIAGGESLFTRYLRELTQFDTAPGWVFTTLANDVLVRKGRWVGEAEAMALLEGAVQRGDAEGMQLLAKMLTRYRDDEGQLNRAVNLLTEAVSRFGLMTAMDDLDTLYRCQANDAPRLSEADVWARAYRATQDRSVIVSAGDLISLDPFKKPEMLAQLQTQALDGRADSLANFVQRVQLDPLAGDSADRLWAARLSQSDKGLENFAELEFALASNPAERDLAVELFRRIYLNNGVTTALDLAVALVEDNGRDKAIAEEIIGLLTKAGNRGEGAAIRLKARLLADTQGQDAVFKEFEKVIEERGDFLALMFAMPYVPSEKVDDYIDRAVSLMTCGTKDADELGDAAAIVLSPDLTYHWREVGLAIPTGHVLSKLNISDPQMALYRNGAAPTERDVRSRELADGDAAARRSLFALAANPDLPSFNPTEAVEQLIAVLKAGSAADEVWALSAFRRADPEVRTLAAQKLNLPDLFRKAAARGDVAAKLELALLQRDTATTIADLQSSARLLKEAADSGNVTAMTELGYVLAYGIGVPADPRAGLIWLEQADQAGDARARDLARLLKLGRAK